MVSLHGNTNGPSPWVTRFAGHAPVSHPVLDVACGQGRHSWHFLLLGYEVTGVDMVAPRNQALLNHPSMTFVEADLENTPWSLGAESYGTIVVSNYLHRPLFPQLFNALRSGGLLIYDTFSAGNERYGKPSNPDFLLKRGELLELTKGAFRILAYEDLEVTDPKPASRQRVAAIKH